MHVACLPALPNLRLPVWCRRFKPTTVVLSVLGDQFRCYCSRSDTSTSKGWMSLIRNCWSVAVQCGSCAEAVGIRDWHASLGADSHCQWHASGPAADLGDLQAPSTSSSTYSSLWAEAAAASVAARLEAVSCFHCSVQQPVSCSKTRVNVPGKKAMHGHML